MRMLNAKGGGGASGWWSQALATRRGSRIAADISSPIVSPILDTSKPNESEPDLSSGSDEEEESEVCHLLLSDDDSFTTIAFLS
jgi:hypothetical protein